MPCQRISVVHGDTDQLHIHVAANIVNPVTGRLANIHMDYKRRADACVDLEAKHGLLATNHEPRKRGLGPAPEVAIVADIEPLAEYARRECPDLGSAKSWEELHEQLARAGLTIQRRGAGMVIASDTNRVKASTVDRALSQAALIKRLGPFAPSNGDHPPPRATYTHDPQSTKVSEAQTLLYAAFRGDKLTTAAQKKRHAELALAERKTMVDEAKTTATVRREGLRKLPQGPAKALLQAQAIKDNADAFAAIRLRGETRARQLKAHLAARPPTVWTPWLQDRAAKGDQNALDALRARRTPTPAKDGEQRTPWELLLEARATEAAEERAKVESGAKTNWTSYLTHVTSRGTVVYRIDNATIRDDGQRFHVRGVVSDQAILVALAMATERYGRVLNVEGDQKFRERVAFLAAASAPDVRFNDRALELQRQTRAIALWEQANDRLRSTRPLSAGHAGAGDAGNRTGHAAGPDLGRQGRPGAGGNDAVRPGHGGDRGDSCRRTTTRSTRNPRRTSNTSIQCCRRSWPHPNPRPTRPWTNLRRARPGALRQRPKTQRPTKPFQLVRRYPGPTVYGRRCTGNCAPRSSACPRARDPGTTSRWSRRRARRARARCGWRARTT